MSKKNNKKQIHEDENLNNSTKEDKTANELPKDTEVSKDTKVPENTETPEKAKVSNNNEVSEDVKVSENTEVPEDTKVSESTEAPNNTEVSEGTKVTENAEVSEDTVFHSVKPDSNKEPDNLTDNKEQKEENKNSKKDENLSNSTKEDKTANELPKDTEVSKDTKVSENTEAPEKAEVPESAIFHSVKPNGNKEPDNLTGNKEQEKKKEEDNSFIYKVIMFVLVIIIIILLLHRCSPATKPGGTYTPGSNPLPIEETQDVYVAPETPYDRSKVVTMPGWGAYNIKANTTSIDRGFEFHNPEENVWYEIAVSYNGESMDRMIVGSGNEYTLNHFLKLAGIRTNAKELKDYNEQAFTLGQNDDNEITINAVGVCDEESSFVIVGEDGGEYKFDLKCYSDCYYMTFALYIGEPSDMDNVELLYQSGLVNPGKYIQTMEISRPLEKGSYNAFVFIQPYRSDRITKTNSGTIVLTLNAK